MKTPRINGLYRHFRNRKIYRVAGIGKDEATQETKVAYVDNEGELWFRKIELWFEEVNEMIEVDGHKVNYVGPRFIEAGESNGIIGPLFGSPSRTAAVGRSRRGL
ncbi:Protein of unknown function [Paenibacillus sp. UNC496MF]|uniref:DUF1653 domain-containing protein n=1 Tax=Paenibacillus sp. UNC496MF TaxID=1502753 RepID=UPI0008F03C89|nr:DUF1653 domain-containing protein [Paenibacillus sp. UNC496MF]SFJ62694.1 Protein of unknown function [Paenibacillus sp. UNC496MF]